MIHTSLSAALEARDKQLNVDVYPYLPYDEKEAIKDAIDESRGLALDWIAKALPILKRVENRMLATDPETWLDYEMQLATLTALITQAEGQKEEENERI